jgi:hypothetical protein
MTEDVAVRFLAEVAERCNGGMARIEQMARDAKASPKLCISYSGHDWTQAHRVKLWLDAAGMIPFFVSSVGDVLSVEERPLTKLLNDTFSDASIVVCLVPPKARLSKWIRLEVDAALTYAKRVIFVRTDPRRPWPAMPSGRNARRFTLRPTQEGQLVALVKKELSALAVSPQVLRGA